MGFLIRSKMILGEENINRFKGLKVAVFGLGGVGSYATEALARCGIGSFKIIDNDKVDRSNINRQIIALNSTVGEFKTEAMLSRMKDINPDIKIEAYNAFYLKGDEVDITDCDYVIDAIDTVTGKLKIAEICNDSNIKLISAMGCGNRIDPSKLQITDIFSTLGCPLCKVMRGELKKRNIEKLKVVYSTEKPVEKHRINDENLNKLTDEEFGRLPGSVAFVPSVAGLLMASEVIKDLIKAYEG